MVRFRGDEGENRFGICVLDLRGMLTMAGLETKDLPGLQVTIVALWLAIRGLGAESLSYDDMEELNWEPL